MNFKTSYSQRFFEKLWFIYGQRLYKALVNKKANFFLKPNDIISLRPTVFAYHEPHIEKLIYEGAQHYNDFFLDLGANVGLTSALVGSHFKLVDSVEPNELVFNILKTNLAMHLDADVYRCHMIGLGQADETLSLFVPRDNFGGAYIEAHNKLLEKKKTETRRAKKASDKAVTEVEVKIKKAADWLASYFADLKAKKLSKGVIKIDVEGYEEYIFESILSTLPQDFEVIIVMENWFTYFPTDRFSSSQHNLKWFYFKKIKRPFHSIPFKFLGLSSSYRFEVQPLSKDTENPHDVICVMTTKGS